MTFEPSYHDDQVEDNHADDNDIHLDDDEEAKMLPHAIHSPHQQQHLKSTLATTSNGRAPYILLTAVVVSCVIGSLSIMSRQQQTTGEYLNLRAPTTTATLLDNATNSSFSLPWELLDLGIYDPKVDFVNEIGISPPYWGGERQQNQQSSNEYYVYPTTGKSTSTNKKDAPALGGTTWGPCYPDRSIVQWNKEDSATSKYEYQHDPSDVLWRGPSSKEGMCRPGFIIIGAGKCGTSSLYHYLLGHPRVAPAFAKQIHYFIYHTNKRLEWYYSWFPKTQSFLQHGALITGEASPGYLPYPKAVKAAFDRLVEVEDNQSTHRHQRAHDVPKFIMIGRNPLTRMYSSYRYNYRTPALQAYQSGQKRGVLGNQPPEYYDQYFFSFEELVQAELRQLKKCLVGGGGAMKTRKRWYKETWTRLEFDKRQDLGLDPLIDLDEVCYGPQVNRTVLREQWADLQMKNPAKYIPPQNAFLIQSLIGRSLYVFPLEWWYILFNPQTILFFCTEDLIDPAKLNELSMQLGLPSIDYTPIVDQGAFNVGTNQGYDQATPWEDLEYDPLLSPPEDFRFQQHKTVSPSAPLTAAALNQESPDRSGDHDTNEEDWVGAHAFEDDVIPLSAELKKELLEFIQPYNERLFALTGKRCQW